jgi:glycosyltransferase involved in cell wall biosynthesis
VSLVAALLLAAGGGLLFIPLAVLAAECVLAALPRRPRNDTGGGKPRTVVLIPAHDEELVLGRTLSSLVLRIPSWARILVVADNCTDGTAAVARKLGIQVVERTDLARRGKGHALQFGLSQLAADPPDVVVALDADCILSEHAVERLARRAHVRQRPVQADNVVEPAQSAGVRARISAFAFTVRNRVRPRGLARAGLPCQLMGTGMAIPFDQFVGGSVAGSHLVEDMVLGLVLAEQGAAPLYADDAHVVSEQPDDPKTSLGQRSRWEQGHLRTLVEHGPKLLWRGLRDRSIATVALALDLLVPPLALLSLLTFGYGAVVLAGCVAYGLRWWAYWAVIDVGLLIGAVGLAWALEGRSLLKPHQFLLVPLYVTWKLPMYVALALRRGQKSWERTQRSTSAVVADGAMEAVREPEKRLPNSKR